MSRSYKRDQTCDVGMIADWNSVADRWVAWARKPGHDSYWRFHRKAFLELVPEPGRLTLDVGCGEGRVGRDLTARGHRVIGLDGSPELARAAMHHTEGHPVIVGDAARIPVATKAVELVVAFMSLHDFDDLHQSVTEIARVLDDGGRLHLAIVHPINSAGAFSGQQTDTEAPFVIDGSYTDTFRYRDDVERDDLEMTFHSWHRPLAAYTEALFSAGFVIESLAEITEPDATDRWFRVPLFLHVVARLD